MAITDEGKKSSAEVFSILIFWFYKLQRLLLFCVNSEFNINFHAGWPNGSADAKVFQEACFKSDLCQDPTRLPPKPPQALLQGEGVEINLAPKLICQLSCNPSATVRQNASQVLNNWMAVVATISSSPEPPMQLANTQPVVLLQSSLPQQHFLPTSSVRTTRGSRSAKPMPKTNREWHILASAQNRWDHWQTNQ